MVWNRRHEPAARAVEQQLRDFLDGQGIAHASHNSALLHEPAEIRNREGQPFRVFTPYWRACLAVPVAEPAEFSAARLAAPERWPSGLALADLAVAAHCLGCGPAGGLAPG